jgi:hypothetical protein
VSFNQPSVSPLYRMFCAHSAASCRALLLLLPSSADKPTHLVHVNMASAHHLRPKAYDIYRIKRALLQ